MNIRKAEERDISHIEEIYAGARAFMAAHGNPTQWNDGYPDEACIRADMKADTLHVIERDGKIAGVFALIIGEDPCYAVIDGAWHAARPYGTIHRIASDGTAKGMARFVFDWCAQQIDYLRIDTHENNRPMQAAVLRYGFQPCGIVQVRGGARLAFDYEVRA